MNDKRFRVLGSNRFFFGEILLEGINLTKNNKIPKDVQIES